MYEFSCSKLSSIKWKQILLCFVGITFLMIVAFSKTNSIPMGKNISKVFWSEKQLKKDSFQFKSVRVPCIEPHCDIECIDIFENVTKDGIIDGSSLSKMQYEHLMIDMNNDQLVNNLIKYIQPPKICPYRQGTGSSSIIYSNMTIKCYPIIFGFADQHLLPSLSREVLLDKKLYKIDQICLPKKSIDFNELIPGVGTTYKFSFENEIDYRRIYRASYFAITKKKAGWDCNRHYEIISSGTMPYFDKLNEAGDYTLSHLPKSLLYEAQRLKGVNRLNMTINHQLFDVNQYYLLLHRLLYYAKHRLTTVKLVEYILNTIGYSIKSSSNHSVLFISHNITDYMKEYMLHGFTRVFEDNLHVFHLPQYLYDYSSSKMWTGQEVANYYKQGLYGGGFGYKLILKNYRHLYERDIKDLPTEAIVKNNIQNRIYSLIVFGSTRVVRLLPFVIQYYNKSKIIIIDGDDEGKNSRRLDYAKNSCFFLREMPNDCDLFL